MRRDSPRERCFNEAAGIHRRKPQEGGGRQARSWSGFNEAAGIHRRKLVGGRLMPRWSADEASMRPPEFTGGNSAESLHHLMVRVSGFNEAAGIHRRKPSPRAAAPAIPPCAWLQ